MKLVQPVAGNGHNITVDNFFTSLSLAQKLARQKTSILGTIRRNRREMPVLENAPFLHTVAYIEEESSCTLSVYQCKKNKNVSILSTYHRHVTVPDAENPKKKPDTVLTYNKTKVGVDVLDQMLKLYSTKPASRRWPVHVFSNILDMGLLNAWILYKMVTKRKESRRDFILAVVEGLLPDARKSTPNRLKRMVASPMTSLPEHAGGDFRDKKQRLTCATGLCKRNRTLDRCKKCARPLCGRCAIFLCQKCR